MNEDWLNKIHDRMADYEIEEPDGLWAGIEAGMTRQTGAPIPARRRRISIWVKRGIAAAAMLALVMTAGYWLVGLSPSLPVSDRFAADSRTGSGRQHQAVSGRKSLPTDGSGYMDSQASASPQIAIPGGIAALSSGAPRSASNLIPAHGHNDTPPLQASPAASDSLPERAADIYDTAANDKKDTITLMPAHPDYRPTSSGRRFTADAAVKATGNGSFSLSAYSSGISGSVSDDYTTRNLFAASLGTDKAYWQDNALMGLPVNSRENEVKTDIKHRMPIRAGISFTYRLTDRLAIESGISYANLTSDIREGTEDHFFTGEQKLHYVGIPVNLKYRMLSWQMVDVYASGGVLAEKCVSARLHKDYFVDRERRNSESVRLADHPVQWSVNAAVGVQCRILQPLAIFAEPGVSYYFDDSTGLQTIYKEKPLNFNLNLGLRLTFGE